jgi:hypothetical protein
LINDGVKIGVSSRCLGSLRESSSFNLVENMHLVAIDAVADPSYPDAFVNGILESREFLISDNGKYEQVYENFSKSLSKIPRKEADSYLREQIVKFINALS